MDATPQVIFEDLVLNANETPSWNATVMECKVTEHASENFNFVYLRVYNLDNWHIAPRHNKAGVVMGEAYWSSYIVVSYISSERTDSQDPEVYNVGWSIYN